MTALSESGQQAAALDEAVRTVKDLLTEGVAHE